MAERSFSPATVKRTRGLKLEAVAAPHWLSAERLDPARAISLRMRPTVEMTLVPPAGVVGARSLDLASLTTALRPWLLVQTDEFGNKHGLEIELEPGDSGIELRVLRGAHRLVATGTAAIEPGRGLSFELKTVGGTSKRRQISFRGLLGEDGKLALETDLPAG